jgi:hypothetical protein
MRRTRHYVASEHGVTTYLRTKHDDTSQVCRLEWKTVAIEPSKMRLSYRALSHFCSEQMSDNPHSHTEAIN